MVLHDNDGFLNACVAMLDARKEKGSVTVTFKRSKFTYSQKAVVISRLLYELEMLLRSLHAGSLESGKDKASKQVNTLHSCS